MHSRIQLQPFTPARSLEPIIASSVVTVVQETWLDHDPVLHRCRPPAQRTNWQDDIRTDMRRLSPPVEVPAVNYKIMSSKAWPKGKKLEKSPIHTSDNRDDRLLFNRVLRKANSVLEEVRGCEVIQKGEDGMGEVGYAHPAAGGPIKGLPVTRDVMVRLGEWRLRTLLTGWLKQPTSPAVTEIEDEEQEGINGPDHAG